MILEGVGTTIFNADVWIEAGTNRLASVNNVLIAQWILLRIP